PRYPPGITQPGLRLWTRAARWPWFELVMCGLLGHAVVGRDVAEVRPEDALVLREIDGVRWHRCLRCDTWMALPAPDVPLREHLPPRVEIELPDRGKPLRDRTIVRLIAVGRAIGFLVLSLLGVLFLLGSSSRAAAESSLSNALTNA